MAKWSPDCILDKTSQHKCYSWLSGTYLWVFRRNPSKSRNKHWRSPRWAHRSSSYDLIWVKSPIADEITMMEIIWPVWSCSIQTFSLVLFEPAGKASAATLAPVSLYVWLPHICFSWLIFTFAGCLYVWVVTAVTDGHHVICSAVNMWPCNHDISRTSTVRSERRKTS